MLVVRILQVVGGVLAMSLIEYVHHRHAGHHASFGDRMRESHRAHHRDPKEGGVRLLTKYRQRLPLVGGVGGASFALGALVASVAASAAFTTGMVLGYLWSEGYHHRMHHRPPTTRIGAWLRRYHYVHHFSDIQHNYGFTSPLWDLVFGTYTAPVAGMRLPTKHLPDGWRSEVDETAPSA